MCSKFVAALEVLNENSVIETLVGWYKVLKNIATVVTPTTYG